MKTADEVKPNFAPFYAAGMYPELAQIFVRQGYALAVHGSMVRDFDLIAVPWVESPSEPQAVLDEIESRFTLMRVSEPTTKPHGRMAYTLNVSFGSCALDLSFMPTIRG
ncbi:MAG TPA: hypothetical protein VGB77_22295 [Abditibacteriaceae bacterium]|jgi:hypothetical protein